jgi:hypothetical protein
LDPFDCIDWIFNRIRHLVLNRKQILETNIQTGKIITEESALNISMRFLLKNSNQPAAEAIIYTGSQILIPLLTGLSFFIVRTFEVGFVRLLVSYLWCFTSAELITIAITNLFFARVMINLEHENQIVILVVRKD